MYLFFRSLVLSTLLLAPFLSRAQEPVMKRFTKWDGLPSNEVFDVAQSKTGFLWLGTDNGLCRFDGQNFRRYHFDGLKDEIIIRVKTHGDTIGFLNIGRELTFIDEKGNILDYGPKDRFRTTAWVQTRDQELWLAHGRSEKVASGVTKINKEGEVQFQEMIEPFNNGGLQWIKGEKNRRLITGSTHSLFQIIDNGNLPSMVREIPIDGGYYINGTYQIAGEVFLVAGPKGAQQWEENFLLVWNGTEFREIRSNWLVNNRIYSLFETSSGKVLVNSNQGVFQISRTQSGDWEVVDRFLEDCFVSRVYEDKDHNLWFPTLNNGLYFQPANAPIKFDIEISTLERGQTYADLLPLSDSSVLAITTNGVVTEFTNGRITSKEEYQVRTPNIARAYHGADRYFFFGPSDLSSFELGKTAASNAKCLYYSTRRQKQRKLYNIKSGASHGDKMWFGNHMSLYECGMDDSCTSILSKRVHSLCVDPGSGRLWVGSEDGLYFHEQGPPQKFSDPSGKSLDVFVNHLAMAGNGTLLVGTQGQGLWKVENGLLLQMSPGENSRIKSIIDLTPGKEEAWVLTDLGLYQVGIADDNWTRMSFQPFNPMALAKAGDDLWISGNDHLIRLPLQEGAQGAVPELLLDQVKAFDEDNQPLDFSDAMPRSTDRVEFFLSMISFDQGVTYQYRINGRAWQPLSDDKLVLTSPGPGDYDIEVRGMLDNGQLSEAYPIQFSIQSEFWRSPMFSILAALVLVLVTLLATRSYYRRKLA